MIKKKTKKPVIPGTYKNCGHLRFCNYGPTQDGKDVELDIWSGVPNVEFVMDRVTGEVISINVIKRGE